MFTDIVVILLKRSHTVFNLNAHSYGLKLNKKMKMIDNSRNFLYKIM